MAVVADRNPWIDPNRVNDPGLGWARYVGARESGDSAQIRIGNSDTHQRDGQNVLFLDSHVAFHTSPTCGVDGDNIYTLASRESGSEKPKETVPKVYEVPHPTERRDSVLVQELPFSLPKAAADDK
jgi:prepilin-type processing-associated H-X9-DG protein